MRLRLDKLETGSEHVEDQELMIDDLDLHFKEAPVLVGKQDINCENEEEILDSIKRKGKKYFDEVREGSNYVTLNTSIDCTWLLGRVKPKHLANMQNEAQENLKNTIEDVFGVGCVEVCDDE